MYTTQQTNTYQKYCTHQYIQDVAFKVLPPVHHKVEPHNSCIFFVSLSLNPNFFSSSSSSLYTLHSIKAPIILT